VEVLAEEQWAWMLYADGARRILCVVCGSVALYELAIELRPAELDAIDELARRVADAPRDYWARNIAGFNDEPGVRAATDRWRAADR
jgi:hypothetical protein